MCGGGELAPMLFLAACALSWSQGAITGHLELVD